MKNCLDSMLKHNADCNDLFELVQFEEYVSVYYAPNLEIESRLAESDFDADIAGRPMDCQSAALKSILILYTMLLKQTSVERNSSMHVAAEVSLLVSEFHCGGIPVRKYRGMVSPTDRQSPGSLKIVRHSSL